MDISLWVKKDAMQGWFAFIIPVWNCLKEAGKLAYMVMFLSRIISDIYIKIGKYLIVFNQHVKVFVKLSEYRFNCVVVVKAIDGFKVIMLSIPRYGNIFSIHIYPFYIKRT